MRAVQLGAARQPQLGGGLFANGLRGTAQLHLRVGQLAEGVPILRRQRRLRPRLLGGIHPQVEQGTHAANLPAGLLTLGQLRLETIESLF